MNNFVFKLFLLLIFCTNSICVEAFSFQKDGIKYEYYYGDLIVVGLVNEFSYDWITIPYDVEYKGKTYRVEAIKKRAFSGSNMSGITCYTISSIEDFAFEYCSYMRKIDISVNNRNIGKGIFCGTQHLKVRVDETNENYDSRNNCNAIIETKTNKLVAGTDQTIIPDNVECIAAYAFSGLYHLDSVYIPKSVKEIEGMAFYDVYGTLSKIYVEAVDPPTIYQDSFSNEPYNPDAPIPYEYTTLYVPEGCMEKYKNHPIWSQFRNIQEYNSTTSIDRISVGKSDDDKYYDTNGNLLKSPSRGLTIIKKKDGTTKKMFIK
jgi:hypothetical protein